MNQESLLNELIKIHTRFPHLSVTAGHFAATSQFCTMWSVDDPRMC